MAEETDGIGEELDRDLRIAVAAAAHLGGQIAARRRDRAQQESEQAAAAARQMQARLAAEGQLARTQFADVDHASWWEQAGPEEIGQAYTAARSWADEDPEAARARRVIEEQLHDRYGIDAANTGANPDAVRDAIDRARARQAHREATGADESADAAVVSQAVVYDSAERRAATEAAMREAGVGEQAVEAHMLADLGQGTPVGEAVRQADRRAAAARRGPAPRERAAELGR